AGSLVIPLMLITLGVSIARLRLVELWPSLLFAVARLIVMFVVAKLIIWGLDLDGIMAGVIILQACMPVAVFNFLFATLYKREADRVAGIVLVSSLMMIIVLPLLVAYVKAG
ncbi:MAG TPA: AEC family transporter, partial [Alphaproteobacteria bacterium]|nr:AEC family transporter [Alphaproteobacteria bacterium]